MGVNLEYFKVGDRVFLLGAAWGSIDKHYEPGEAYVRVQADVRADDAEGVVTETRIGGGGLQVKVRHRAQGHSAPMVTDWMHPTRLDHVSQRRAPRYIDPLGPFTPEEEPFEGHPYLNVRRQPLEPGVLQPGGASPSLAILAPGGQMFGPTSR